MNKSIFTELILPMLMWAVVGLPVANAQTEQVNDKYRVVLRLNDSTYMSLKNSGYVKAEVPKSQRDKIVAVKIVKQGAFFDEPVELEAEASVSRGVLSIKITNAVLEQLEFRPVMLKVTENGFSKVLLDYQAAKTDNSAATQSTPPLRQIDEKSRFFVRRYEENGIVAGTPDGSVLSVKTDYGAYDVPWIQIEAAYLGQTQNVSVILRNGDKISGKLNQNKIKLLTAWGDHEVDPSKLYSFTRTSEQEFLATNSQDGAKFLLFTTTENRRSIGY